MPAPDRSHVAMAVNLDACIQCNLCVRACREVQVNDVIGMAGRGHGEKIVFDFDDPMGASTCVACGECVQACPTGALMPATLVDDEERAHASIPGPRGGQRVPLLRRRLPAHLPDQGRQAALRHRQGRPGEPEPAVREGPLRLRLRQQSAAPDQADGAQGRRAEMPPTIWSIPSNPWTHFREATWEEAMERAACGPEENPRPRRPARARRASARPRARTKRPICSRSWCAPASAPTTSITARGFATPRRWRRCSKASARRR